MGKPDPRKTYKMSLWAQEWSLDQMPSKKTKKAKAKQRQLNKKLCKQLDE